MSPRGLGAYAAALETTQLDQTEAEMLLRHAAANPDVLALPTRAAWIAEVAAAAPPDPFAVEVERAAERLRVQDAARRLVAAERAAEIPEPGMTALADLLDEPDEDAAYRVAGLLPAGGNAILAAQYKAGKTTLLANFVRSLADGTDFLGAFGVEGLREGERVAVLDLELDRRTLRRWLRDGGIANPGAVLAESMRGRVGQFDVMDDNRRAAWASLLRDAGVRVLLVDPLAPLLAAYGIAEEDNGGVAGVLNALDELKAEAGISELVVAHHMGHSSERSRGASRLQDWPDAIWTIVRDGDPMKMPSAHAERFFAALGRDVAVEEALLQHNPATRRLTLVGGNRTERSVTKWAPVVLDAIRDNPGIVTSALEPLLKAKGVPQADGRATRKSLMDEGRIHTHTTGKVKAAVRHYVGACTTDCPGHEEFNAGLEAEAS